MSTRPLTPQSSLFGILSSQVGYEAHLPKLVLIRSTERSRVTEPGQVLVLQGDREVASSKAEYWGHLWGSHWWRADLSGVTTPGRYVLRFASGGTTLAADDIEIGRQIIWGKTFDLSAIDQLERRSRFADTKLGWLDAGMPWFELNAHASTILALCEVLTLVPGRLTGDQRQRLERQVINGCDYQCLLQDEAAKRGLPAGSLSHQVPKFEDIATKSDANKAAAAWASAARVLASTHPDKSAGYLRRAEAALAFATAPGEDAGYGFNHKQRGLPETYVPPKDDVRTRDLFMSARAALELAGQSRPHLRETAVELLDRAMSRQAQTEQSMHGFSGWFYEFSDLHHPEPAWAHQLRDRKAGGDLGATHAYDVGVFLQALTALPDHPRAPAWRNTLERFAYGFFLPACRANPFYLLPHQLHPEQGLITFAGPWHGMNCIYGQAAALAFDFARFFSDSAFIPVATGNLQWICGLNAGNHRENIAFCHIYSADLVPGEVLPVSMIHGVGNRFAGTWLNFRGTVTNGFSVGEQFHFDAPLSREVDGPHSLSDEDWIPHAAALVSALCRVSDQ
jgi:hypothetical protein